MSIFRNIGHTILKNGGINMKKESVCEILDLGRSLVGGYIGRFEYPWQALEDLGDEILRIGDYLPSEQYKRVSEDVWISKDAVVSETAYLGGPLIVCRGAEIRHAAFIRGNAVIGDGAVVGNSTELKNCVLFESVQVPHYNYVGDSILGYGAHLGAGAVTSNLRSDKKKVVIHFEDENTETGMKKLGAIVGDGADIGCGAVLCPGAVVGKNTVVYPLSIVRGTVDSDRIYKRYGDITERR